MRSMRLGTRNADNDNDNNKDNKNDKDIVIDIENAFFHPMRSHKNVQNLFKSHHRMFITCLELQVLNIVLNNQPKIVFLITIYNKKRHIRRCVFVIFCFFMLQPLLQLLLPEAFCVLHMKEDTLTYLCT